MNIVADPLTESKRAAIRRAVAGSRSVPATERAIATLLGGGFDPHEIIALSKLTEHQHYDLIFSVLKRTKLNETKRRNRL